jgi:hypothetical protein
MRRRCLVAVFLFCLVAWSGRSTEAASPLEPFEPDEHTLLLYHFDEGQGSVAKDSSRYGYDGEVRGARWETGKFGGALQFDGQDDSVFRHVTEAIENLRTITVECWFKQENPEGRQFLVGKDVTIHFDLSGGNGTSISLYNQGGAKANAEGLRHQQVGAGIGPVRLGRWHHLAATYDGHQASFFCDGVLKKRLSAPKDFLLGTRSRGLWVGSYVGTDYWFSGKIDEVRISDSVRYDPEGKLAVGGRAFVVAEKKATQKSVRTPQRTGAARLQLVFKKAFGGKAAGWVYLKSPGKRAVIVGRFELSDLAEGAERSLEFDVSDELAGDGTYIVGMENTDGGYYSVTRASLAAGEKPLATWSGQAASRRTFQPPVLVPLRVGQSPAVQPSRILLLPEAIDRLSGNLEVGRDDASEPLSLFGEGLAEYWLDLPKEQTYRVYLRYAAPGRTPCDIVVDGRDLNDYNMCTLNRTDSSLLRDALWEYQGTTQLGPGLHWIRLQDVLPAIVGMRLEPVASAPERKVPWARYPVPEGGFLGRAAAWQAEPLFGLPKDATVTLDKPQNQPTLRFSVSFANIAQGELLAGDAVRLVHRGAWDLEPFGRLRFRFEGQGSGHVVALWAVDVKGDEKLLWRMRDKKTGPQEVSVPVSFEGNDVFDPGHVVALCLELDEGNVKADQVNRFSGSLAGVVFDRRDLVVEPDGYPQTLAAARQAMAERLKQPGQKAEPLRAAAFRPWTKPVVPEEHPLFASTEPKPVTRKTLGYPLHMTGARNIEARVLDQFHKHYDFGDVCWPNIGICPQRRSFKSDEDYQAALGQFEKRLEEVRARGLYLFDVWGYVPYHPDFPHTAAQEHRETLLRVFGDRFLGFDNGEQDGRYIGAYASQGTAKNRKEGWDDFVKWDEYICANNADYMNATGSLNFSHYYAERNCRLLGLETAQGLPSDTLMFAFLRGAGKQYGRLTYQASSIWNRYGYNMYHDRKTAGLGAAGYGLGPNKGCSLSLHKGLFFCGYLDGHSIFGTEAAQFTADEVAEGVPELSPLGKQHLKLHEWSKRQPDRGVLATPVAFMLDFYNGWNMPRHLYRGDKYKIWGKFPYEKGDYLIDAMFRMVWPGYEDASYLRNERGFITPTPLGDSFDVITNRCHPAVLRQYSAVMLLGDVEMTPEVVTRLTEYVQAGGDLVTDVRGARALPATIAGVQFGAEAKGCLSHSLSSGETFDELPYRYTILTLPAAATLLVNEHGHPLVTVNKVGQGRVIVSAVDHWMTDALTYQAPEIVNMEPPYQLLRGVRAVLATYFDSFNPVEISPSGLNVHTCCYNGDPKHLRVGLINSNLFAPWRGRVHVRLGQVASAVELWRGWTLLPEDLADLEIPAGDAAIVDIRLK